MDRSLFSNLGYHLARDPPPLRSLKTTILRLLLFYKRKDFNFLVYIPAGRLLLVSTSFRDVFIATWLIGDY